MSPHIAALLAAFVTAASTGIVGYYSWLGRQATIQIEQDQQAVDEDRADVEKNAAILAGFESLVAQLQAQNTAMSEQLSVSRKLLREANDEADECQSVLRALRREVIGLRSLLAAGEAD